MHKSESAPTLGAALAVTKHEPADEQENGSIPSVPRLPIRSLEPLIEYYIGRPEPQTPHEKRVNKLLAENKNTWSSILLSSIHCLMSTTKW